MKLDLSCTENTAHGEVGHLAGGADLIDIGDVRPSHPVLIVDRAECDLDANSSFTIPPEVLHIKVIDPSRTDKSSKGCAAHFHIRVGVKKGRPFVDVCALGHDSSTDNKKKATGVWMPVVSK